MPVSDFKAGDSIVTITGTLAGSSTPKLVNLKGKVVNFCGSFIGVDFGEDAEKIRWDFHNFDGLIPSDTGYYVHSHEIALVGSVTHLPPLPPAVEEKIEKGYKNDGQTWVYGTQKAEGVRILKARDFRVPKFSVVKAAEIGDTVTQYGFYFPRFARPCPVCPRHGFVDSRVVNSWDELLVVRDETLKADPKGEIMFMPVLNAVLSGVWTPGRLTIGKGNNGATAGQGAITIPVRGELVNAKVATCAHVYDAPYVELIWQDGDDDIPFLVQLRDGPKLPQTIDFITKPVKVGRVVKAEGELLQWEALVKTLNPESDVVWHPGGSLSSHYAVHAVINGVAVMISKEPKEGDLLEPTNEAPQPDAKKFQKGFITAMKMKVETAQLAYLMLTGLHNAVEWVGRQDFLLGVGMGAAFRLTLAACMGELRHAKIKAHACDDDACEKNKYTKAAGSGNRSKVYEKAFTNSWAKRNRLLVAFDGFHNLEWPSSFGGYKWAKIAWYGLKLMENVRKEDVKESLMAYNTLVNLAHNANWAFDKFVESYWMDKATKNPIEVAVLCANSMYSATTESVVKKVPKWAVIELPKFDDDGVIWKNAKKKGKAMVEEDKKCGDHSCESCYPPEEEEEEETNTSQKGPSWVKLPDEKKKDVSIIKAQVTINNSTTLYLQVVYNETERQSYAVFVGKDVVSEVTQQKQKGNTVPSLSGSGTPYVPLVKHESGTWGLSPEMQIISEKGEALNATPV